MAHFRKAVLAPPFTAELRQPPNNILRAPCTGLFVVDADQGP